LRRERTQRSALSSITLIPASSLLALGRCLFGRDAKTTIEAARYLSWRACHALDTQSPSAGELAVQAKIYGSEAAVRVISGLMQVVGIDSYDHEAPFGSLLQDALALPIFDGGNMGVRRRQLHAMFMQPEYDPLAACGAA
jgi:nitroalkane oxidase